MTSISYSCYVERIAIVKPDALGDLVLLSTTLRYLRSIRPECHITLFVSEELVDYTRLCPYINEVVGAFSKTNQSLDKVIKEATNYLERIPTAFDKVILARWDIDYYFASHLCAMLPSVSKHAYSERVTIQKGIMNKGFDSFFTHHYVDSEVEHEHTKNLKLIGLVFGHQVTDSWYQERTLSWFGIADEIWIQHILSTTFKSFEDCPIIVIAPEASEEYKMLDYGSWLRISKLAKEVFEKFDPYYFIIGTKKHAQLCGKLTLIFNKSVNLCGVTTISNLSKLLSSAKVVLAMDSGVSHLASSFEAIIIQFRCSTDDVNPNSAKSKLRFRPFNGRVGFVEPVSIKQPCIEGHCQSKSSHCINNFSDETLLNQFAEVQRHLQR